MCSRALSHAYKNDITANLIQHNSYAAIFYQRMLPKISSLNFNELIKFTDMNDECLLQ